MTLLLSQQPRILNGNSCMIGEETECELEDLAKHVRFDFLDMSDSATGSGAQSAGGGIRAPVYPYDLPSYDRGVKRNPSSRPLYATSGVIMVSELVTLTIWGYLTPGQQIPATQAAAIMGAAAVVAALSSITYRARRMI